MRVAHILIGAKVIDGTVVERSSVHEQVIKATSGKEDLFELRFAIEKISSAVPTIAFPPALRHYLKNASNTPETKDHSVLRQFNFFANITRNATVKDMVTKQHNIISNDLVSLIEAKVDDCDKISTFNRVEHADKYELNAEEELSYGDNSVKIMALNATDDPILQAHTKKSFALRPLIEIPRNPSYIRYLPPRFQRVVQNNPSSNDDIAVKKIKSFPSKKAGNMYEQEDVAPK